ADVSADRAARGAGGGDELGVVGELQPALFGSFLFRQHLFQLGTEADQLVRVGGGVGEGGVQLLFAFGELVDGAFQLGQFLARGAVGGRIGDGRALAGGRLRCAHAAL